MAAAPVTVDQRSHAAAPTTPRGRGAQAAVPVLEPRPGSYPARFAQALSNRHPVTVFIAAAILGYVVLVTLSVALGLLLTQVVLHSGAVTSADDRFPDWLAGHRTAALTDG